jgi:putative phosphoesterase
MVFKVGIISDTHGLLRPAALRALAGADHIIHGGDIGRADILDELRRIAPVTAIRGNVDTGDWAKHYAETETIRIEGHLFYVLHDRKALSIDPAASGIDVVISGHSHRVRIETIGGVLYLNPGSAGPRRFKLPITLATLDVGTGDLQPVIHDLGSG